MVEKRHEMEYEVVLCFSSEEITRIISNIKYFPTKLVFLLLKISC